MAINIFFVLSVFSCLILPEIKYHSKVYWNMNRLFRLFRIRSWSIIQKIKDEKKSLLELVFVYIFPEKRPHVSYVYFTRRPLFIKTKFKSIEACGRCAIKIEFTYTLNNFYQWRHPYTDSSLNELCKISNSYIACRYSWMFSLCEIFHIDENTLV